MELTEELTFQIPTTAIQMGLLSLQLTKLSNRLLSFDLELDCYLGKIKTKQAFHGGNRTATLFISCCYVNILQRAKCHRMSLQSKYKCSEMALTE